MTVKVGRRGTGVALAVLVLGFVVSLFLFPAVAGDAGGASDAVAGSDAVDRSDAGGGTGAKAPSEADGTAPDTAGRDASPNAGGGEVRPASAASFLTVLDEGRETDEGPSTVSWTEGRGLIAAATDVLDAYRCLGTASLATSGYLDLSGNVWAALLVDASEWTDMVTVTDGGEDGTATVHVLRLWAREVEGS